MEQTEYTLKHQCLESRPNAVDGFGLCLLSVAQLFLPSFQRNQELLKLSGFCGELLKPSKRKPVSQSKPCSMPRHHYLLALTWSLMNAAHNVPPWPARPATSNFKLLKIFKVCKTRLKMTLTFLLEHDSQK